MQKKFEYSAIFSSCFSSGGFSDGGFSVGGFFWRIGGFLAWIAPGSWVEAYITIIVYFVRFLLHLGGVAP